MLDDKTFDPKDEFGCRKHEVSFKEKNKSKLIRLLFRLDGSNGNHIINVPMGMHFTYPEFYIFQFLNSTLVTYLRSKLYPKQPIHFILASFHRDFQNLPAKNTWNVKQRHIGHRRQQTNGTAVYCVCHVHWHFVCCGLCHFLDSWNIFSFLLLRLLTVNSNTLSVLHPGTVGTVPIFSAVSTFWNDTWLWSTWPTHPWHQFIARKTRKGVVHDGVFHVPI